MIRQAVVEGLQQLGVPTRMLDSLPKFEATRGVLVFGSRARGDAVTGSDLDLLALVHTPRPSADDGNVSVSYYTSDQLASGVGTLFGAHLKRDAKVLWDPDGTLDQALASFGDVETNRLFDRALQMSTLFTSLERDLPKYLPGLLREARYLLRSCLYARAIASGDPCFSVRELANRSDDPQLVSLLASRQEGPPTVDELNGCLVRLKKIIGEFPMNKHGSLEATIVNEWDRPGDLLSMAFLALGVTGKGNEYAEVEKILL